MLRYFQWRSFAPVNRALANHTVSWTRCLTPAVVTAFSKPANSVKRVRQLCPLCHDFIFEQRNTNVFALSLVRLDCEQNKTNVFALSLYNL